MLLLRFYMHREARYALRQSEIFLSLFPKENPLKHHHVSDSFQANISHHVTCYPIPPNLYTLFRLFFDSTLNKSFQGSWDPNSTNMFEETSILNIIFLPPCLSYLGFQQDSAICLSQVLTLSWIFANVVVSEWKALLPLYTGWFLVIKCPLALL